MSHLPISEDELKGSVTKMIETTKAFPDFKEGYKIWRDAFDQGKGDYFTIPVSECVEYMEKAINR